MADYPERPGFLFPGPPPKEVLEYFRRKGYKLGFSYLDVWREEHATAFTVAKAMELDILEAIRAEVDKALAEGRTFQQFQKELRPILEALGWWGRKEMVDPVTGEVIEAQLGSPRRLQVIFDTNLRTARAVAQWERIQRTKDVLPYLLYTVGPSREHRLAHLAWHGTLLPADDPWWETHFAPNGWGCFLPGTGVATPNGWKAIETLRAGDWAFGGSGDIQSVKSAQVRPFEGEIVRITTEEVEVAATPNHRFLTLRGWVRAENLKAGEILVQVPQVAGLDDSVCYVKHPHAASAQLGMARPVGGIQAIAKAFDPDVDSRQEYIHPVWKEAAVVRGLETPFRQLLQKQRLATSGWYAGIDVAGRVLPVLFPLGARHLGANIGPARGCGVFQLFGAAAHPIICFLGFAESIVAAFHHLLQRSFAQNLRAVLAPGVIVDPLDAYPFAIVAGGYSEMAHQANDRPVAALPPLAELRNRESLIDVEDPEGFTSGAPLDFFDSLESFRTWARAHGELQTVQRIKREHYIGNVHNLTIAKDASYCLRLGVVHNCKCRIRQVSRWEYDRITKTGIPGPPAGSQNPGTVEVITQAPPVEYVDWLNKRTGKVEKVPKGIDPGWDYNPGKVSRQARAEELLREKEARFRGREPPAS